jgi:hypothetical protein
MIGIYPYEMIRIPISMIDELKPELDVTDEIEKVKDDLKK